MTMSERDIEAYNLQQSVQKRYEWARYTADMIYRIWLAPRDGDEEDRKAARVAMAALNFLAEPPTQEVIMVHRPPFTIAGAAALEPKKPEEGEHE